jgi:hypothetical protein
MPTGSKQGWIMIEYKCRVLSSSAKLTNLKVVGFSKLSESSVREEEWIV